MAIPLDVISRKRIILVKQLYLQAIARSGPHQSQVDRLMSVIGLDLAVETVLKAIVSALEPSKQPADAFQSLLQQADSQLQAAGLTPLPNKVNVQHVHSLRNDAQHKARYPNDSEANDCRTYVRDVLQSLLANVWGVDLQAISLVELVRHVDVRRYLSSAETYYAQGDYTQASQQALAALESALMRVRRAIVGRQSHSVKAIVVEGSFGKTEPSADLYRAFERMQNTLQAVALGIDYPDYLRCLQIVGLVVFTIDGAAHFIGADKPIDQRDSEFVLAYCTDAVVQIEDQVTDLDAPFGREYWQ